MKQIACLVVLFLELFLGGSESAAVFRFANIYGSHMVLQKAPQRARIWGFGEVGQKVLVALGKKVYCSDIRQGPGKTGVWSVTLRPQKAGGPHTIKAFSYVKGLKVMVKLQDVLFGDVWICNGQSNMELAVRMTSDSENAIKESIDYDKIRLFTAGLNYSDTPLSELKNIRLKWSRASPQKLGGVNEPQFEWTDEELFFSGVCWHYGKRLYDTLRYPVGLIAAAVNGAPVETWSPPEVLRKCSVTSFNYGNLPYFDLSNLWNAMIHPFVRMSIYGVVYYQGETNAISKANDYSCMFPGLIDAYRANWYEGTEANTRMDFPFGFVQLSTFKTGPGLEFLDYASIRWDQTARYGYVPNERQKKVFMAVTMDLGNPYSPFFSAHPTDKRDVGERLARSSLAIAYGKKLYYSGPLVSKIKLQKKGGNKQLEISYRSVKRRIEVRQKKEFPAVGFQVLCEGSDKWLNASITEQRSTSLIIKPSINCCYRKVRYAWNTNPCFFKHCLIYSGNLPSPPFIKDGPF